MENFTPVSATLGGILIGLSAIVLMAFNGRIAGISSIFSGIAFSQRTDKLWRLSFVMGLIVSPLLYIAVTGRTPAMTVTPSYGLLIAGGLLVGFGTQLGSGCTSGHGVCGISRLSRRSLVAVIVFMTAGAVTVAVIKKMLGA